MKVKQIVSEFAGGYGSIAPTQSAQDGKQQYKVAPTNTPAQPGQKQMVKLIPANATPGSPGQDPQGTVTVGADQIDMTDPANPKLSPQALSPQAQTPNQQPNAMANKTVTMGMEEELTDEDMLAGGAGLETKPDRLNTFFVSMQGGKPAALMGGRGPQLITPSPKWPTLTPEVEAKLKTQSFDVVYLKVNGKLIPAASGGGMLYVGSQDFPSLTAGSSQTSQPLQQEEQGEANGLSRIAHLAGIR
jgi:hypothetical protein